MTKRSEWARKAKNEKVETRKQCEHKLGLLTIILVMAVLWSAYLIPFLQNFILHLH